MNLSKFKGLAKIVGFILVLLALLGATIFLGRRASNLFVKASSCPVKSVKAQQVGSNNAVITWETDEVSQAVVEYGISANNLTFSAPETTSGKTHNVPLNLLTPNTNYYYLVKIGELRCDTSGQDCGTACVPWSFTTEQVIPQDNLVAPLPTVTTIPTVTSIPTVTPQTPHATPTKTLLQGAGDVSPTTGLSQFCQKVYENVGSSSLDAATWQSVKQYDIDGNNIINGLDVVKCQKEGR